MNAAVDRSYALVTKTYRPDLAQCNLLVESLERCAPDVVHHLIVDKDDRAAFAHLAGRRRQIIETEALLGDFAWRLPATPSIWLTKGPRPVHGWIMQQIAKIAAVDATSEATLVFCDSDTSFIRRFGRDDLLVDGRIGLLDRDFCNDDTRRWTAAARRLLGISRSDGVDRDHVGCLVCWNRRAVAAMRSRIESSTGMDWKTALVRTPSLSEYMLYGVFVREVLGYAAVDQAPLAAGLTKNSWGNRTDEALDAFFASIDARKVGVMIHSGDRVDPARYRHHLEAFWSRIPPQ